jgi:hypothetical protein
VWRAAVAARMCLSALRGGVLGGGGGCWLRLCPIAVDVVLELAEKVFLPLRFEQVAAETRGLHWQGQNGCLLRAFSHIEANFLS